MSIAGLDIAVLTSGLDDWLWVLIAVGTVIYQVVEARNKNTEDDGPSAADELAATEALAAEVATGAQRLGSTQAWRGPIGPVWLHVLSPKVDALLGFARKLPEANNPQLVWSASYRRQRLEWLMEQLASGAQGGSSGLWIGSALMNALDEIEDEVGTLFQVHADPDLVSAGGQLTRESLQHLYAAWGGVLFADVATAALDPAAARDAMRAVEVSKEAHVAQPGSPPDYLRAVAIGAVLSEPFRGHLPDGELIIQTTYGTRFALPAPPMVEDITALAVAIAARQFGALGGKSVVQLGGASTTIRAVPKTVRTKEPSGRAEREARPARAAREAGPARAAREVGPARAAREAGPSRAQKARAAKKAQQAATQQVAAKKRAALAARSKARVHVSAADVAAQKRAERVAANAAAKADRSGRKKAGAGQRKIAAGGPIRRREELREAVILNEVLPI